MAYGCSNTNDNTMINITDNFRVNKPAPIDDRLGPFVSTASALSSIEIDRRHIGLTVIIDDGTGAVEYWFKDGVSNGDLELKATGGGAQVNSDWNATSGVAEILNKPSIPAAQVNSDWNATSGVAQILNKPTIPSVSGLVPYTGANSNVNLGTYNLTADQLALNVSPTGTLAVGMTEWNDSIGSSQTLLKGGSVTLKNGVDLVARVVNKVNPNTTLTKASYQVVKVAGAQGQRLAVNLAQANTDLNSADTLGVVTETIAPNQEGFILTVGQLENINTTGSLQGETWNDGDVLYLSPTTAGRMTNIKPNASTGHIVVIGYVEYAHNNNGKIYVKIMNGWELDELHNVYINPATLANNDALVYESATDLWKNKQIFPITVGTAGSVSITITATGAANLQSLTGHSFTINEASMPLGSTITINGMAERIATGTGIGGISYDINGVKRYYTSPSGHQYQYQITIYRESSTAIRMMGGSVSVIPQGAFGSANIGSTTAAVTAGGNIVFQLFGFGSVLNDQIAYRFFKAVLTR
jgi:nitrogen fixation protein